MYHTRKSLPSHVNKTVTTVWHWRVAEIHTTSVRFYVAGGNGADDIVMFPTAIDVFPTVVS